MKTTAKISAMSLAVRASTLKLDRNTFDGIDDSKIKYKDIWENLYEEDLPKPSKYAEEPYEELP